MNERERVKARGKETCKERAVGRGRGAGPTDRNKREIEIKQER